MRNVLVFILKNEHQILNHQNIILKNIEDKVNETFIR
jgi:hypothetical protein